jgi:hypothetical protein
MHPNQATKGRNRRLFISLQHRKPRPGLRFRYRRGLANRSPRKVAGKIKFAPSMARMGKCVPPHARTRGSR